MGTDWKVEPDSSRLFGVVSCLVKRIKVSFLTNQTLRNDNFFTERYRFLRNDSDL